MNEEIEVYINIDDLISLDEEGKSVLVTGKTYVTKKFSNEPVGEAEVQPDGSLKVAIDAVKKGGPKNANPYIKYI